MANHSGPSVLRVWRIDLDDPRWDVDAAAARLTDDERLCAQRALPDVRRRRVLVRWALRLVLSRQLGVRAADLVLDGIGQRPVVHGHPSLSVSCSSSGALGLVAVSHGAAAGIDVEGHRNEDARRALHEDWLADDERALLAELPPSERLRAVTRCWTHKEAVLKAEGTGLRRSPAAVLTPVAEHGVAGPWSLLPVTVAEGFVASVAVGSPGARPPVPTIVRPTDPENEAT